MKTKSGNMIGHGIRCILLLWLCLALLLGTACAEEILELPFGPDESLYYWGTLPDGADPGIFRELPALDFTAPFRFYEILQPEKFFHLFPCTCRKFIVTLHPIWSTDTKNNRYAN